MCISSTENNTVLLVTGIRNLNLLLISWLLFFSPISHAEHFVPQKIPEESVTNTLFLQHVTFHPLIQDTSFEGLI